MRPEPIVNFGYPMPAVRILVPLVVGLFAGWYWNIDSFRLTVWFSSLFILAFIMVALTRGSLTAAWMQGAGIFLCILVSGMLMMRLSVEQLEPPPLNKFETCDLTALVIREPGISSKGYRLKVKVINVQTEDGEMIESAFNAWWYAPALPEISHLLHGDTLITRSVFFPLESPVNPSVFDFKAWSNFQGVSGIFRYNQQFPLHIIPSTNATSIVRKALALRQQQIEILRQYMNEGRELAVGMAILLGKRDDIDRDLRQAYADTGAVHVLAVSGLHVGIVAFVLKWLLGLIIPSFTGDKWLKLVLNLAGIWGFALITGLPPSVQRASIMFSLFIAGITLSKRRNGYNTLAVAATIMLITNPLLLFDVGFRLSFSAVWGILFFHPRIYPMVQMPVAWMDAAWSLLAVSLAATLGTLPFTLYYFNQFPVFFWLSGWVVIPAATVIVWLGLATLTSGNLAAFSYIFEYAAWFMAQMLYGVIWIMNAVVFMIQSIPVAVIKHITPGTLGLILLISLLVSVAGWIKFRHATARIMTCICLIGLGLMICSHTWHSTRTFEKVTYALRQGNMTAFYAQGKLLSVFDEDGEKQQNMMELGNPSGHVRERSSVKLEQGEYVRVMLGNTCFLMGDNILLKAEPCQYIIPFTGRIDLSQALDHANMQIIGRNPLPYSDNREHAVKHHNLLQHGAHILRIRGY